MGRRVGYALIGVLKNVLVDASKILNQKSKPIATSKHASEIDSGSKSQSTSLIRWMKKYFTWHCPLTHAILMW